LWWSRWYPLRNPFMQVVKMPCIGDVCMKFLVGCFLELFEENLARSFERSLVLSFMRILWHSLLRFKYEDLVGFLSRAFARRCTALGVSCQEKYFFSVIVTQGFVCDVKKTS
jgi:hypothetical protein